jgi:NTP pyrophosphohydrolases including oxidative damage repair enzymes
MSRPDDPNARHLTEEQLHSQLIYDGKVVHLYLDTVKLPDGSTTRREIVRHSGAVAILPLDSDGRIVLVRQYRYAAGRTLLEIPAGTLEIGESPDVCAVRELQEEIGYRPGRLQKIGGIFVAPGYTTEYIHLYLATDLVPSRLDADDDEFFEVLHLPLSEVLARIKRGEIADAKTISAILLAQEHLK